MLRRELRTPSSSSTTRTRSLAMRSFYSSRAAPGHSSCPDTLLGGGRRQLDHEARAARPVALDPDASVVIGDNAVHDRQPQAGPLLLGREIGQEQPVAVLVADAGAVVGDLEPHRA